MPNVDLCAIRGSVGGGDIFQFGFALQTDKPIESVASAVDNHFTAHFLVADPMAYSGTTTFSDVVASRIDVATGVVLESAQALIGISGSNGAASLPSEVAVCVTLNPVAGTQKGRFYLPCPSGASLAPQGRLATDWQISCATRLKNFFDALGSDTSPARVGIYSRKNRAYVGARSLSVGNVFDAQRRRRNKLVEARETRTLL